MKSLQEFLNNHPVEGMTTEVVISDRFRDENGKLYKFKIRALTNEEYNDAIGKSNSFDDNGRPKINNKAYANTIVINNTVEPNFKDAESIKKLGLHTPEQYLSKVLLAGEIMQLSKEIAKFSGFNKDINALIEEAKN